MISHTSINSRLHCLWALIVRGHYFLSNKMRNPSFCIVGTRMHRCITIIEEQVSLIKIWQDTSLVDINAVIEASYSSEFL